MLPTGIRCVLAVAAVVGWGLLITAAVSPWEPGLNVSLLALAMAGVGSVVSAMCWRNHPVMQVLEAGRAIGRAEARMEAECGVARIDRRHLRVVDGD